MPVVSHNRNRMHAIKQFKKGLMAIDNMPSHEEAGDVRMLGAIVNALIYMGDSMNELNETLKNNNHETAHLHSLEDEGF